MLYGKVKFPKIFENISEKYLKLEYQPPPGRKSISRVSDVKFPPPSGTLLTSNGPDALLQGISLICIGRSLTKMGNL